jgi:dUTPase
LEADSIEFMPVTDVNGTALVKSHADDSRFKGGESGIFIGSGEATDVDCGIKIEIAAGYKVNVESLVGSLLAVTSRIEENRLVVTLVNIGKDRVFLRYGSLVGRMVASPVYVFDYQGKP